jgi:hypothetical protein
VVIVIKEVEEPEYEEFQLREAMGFDVTVAFITNITLAYKEIGLEMYAHSNMFIMVGFSPATFITC